MQMKISVGGKEYAWDVTEVPPPVEPPPPVTEPEPPIDVEPDPVEPPPPAAQPGVLISHEELMARPTSGIAWGAVLKTANTSIGMPNLSDMNDDSELRAVACALAAVRLNDATLRVKATNILNAAIGTEENVRWLQLGRNLGGWIVVADILGIRSGPAFDWLDSFMDVKHPHNNTGTPETIQQNAWSSGSNASAQMGWVHAALAAYLGDKEAIAWGWMAFRRYCGDRNSAWQLENSASEWQVDNADPVGIQNAGATIGGVNVDGAVSSDMARGGGVSATPGYTAYPWVGLNGAILAAEVFYRAGYPAYTIADKALLRAATYLKNLGGDWYDASTRRDVKHLINRRYSVSYPCALPVGASGLVGWTDVLCE